MNIIIKSKKRRREEDTISNSGGPKSRMSGQGQPTDPCRGLVSINKNMTPIISQTEYLSQMVYLFIIAIQLILVNDNNKV